MVSWKRLFRHGLMPGWWARRCFSPKDLAAIEQAVAVSERRHRGELVVAIEGPLPLRSLLREHTPRERALALFGELGVWDTEENNGVLLYLQLVDHDIEIVADRGITRRVPDRRWNEICRQMEAHFAAGRFGEGLLTGIAAITTVLEEQFPAALRDADQLPNRPQLL